MGKLRIRINNKDILKTTNHGYCPGTANRQILFGIEDDLERMELHSDGATEYLGFMDQLSDGIYLFGIDRYNADHYSVDTIHVLDANNRKDFELYKLALEHDYGFSPDDYTILE